jgi:hypothetical protein
MRLSGAVFAALLASAAAAPADTTAFAHHDRRQARPTTTSSSSSSLSTTAAPKATGSASVVRLVGADIPQYVVNITIGGQAFTHLLDTGSAQDWVFGRRYPENLRGGNKAIYTPEFN